MSSSSEISHDETIQSSEVSLENCDMYAKKQNVKVECATCFEERFDVEVCKNVYDCRCKKYVLCKECYVNIKHKNGHKCPQCTKTCTKEDHITTLLLHDVFKRKISVFKYIFIASMILSVISFFASLFVSAVDSENDNYIIHLIIVGSLMIPSITAMFISGYKVNSYKRSLEEQENTVIIV